MKFLSEEIYKKAKMYNSRIQEKPIVYVHKMDNFIYLHLIDDVNLEGE